MVLPPNSTVTILSLSLYLSLFLSLALPLLFEMSGGGEDANEVIFKRRYILRKWFQKQTFYGSSKIVISH